MPSTSNKGYEVQTTGSNTGTWGAILNDQALAYIDQNMGGITSLSLSSSNVTLSASESRNAILRLSGTLTGNIVITTACIGFFFVENLTSGAFTVTVRNASVATAATIPRGSRQTVISDASNGCRIMSSGFETGVKTVFYMSTAPIGWTRDTTAALNNAALRLVTTGGAATGGSVDFTTAFSASRITIAQANLPNITLTSSINGAHVHSLAGGAAGETNDGSGSPRYIMARSTNNNGNLDLVPAYVQSNGDHQHTVPLGGSGTAISLAVKYADFLVATRD